jgi:transposase
MPATASWLSVATSRHICGQLLRTRHAGPCAHCQRGAQAHRRILRPREGHPWLQPEERRITRQQKSQPLADTFEQWLRAKLGLISQKGKLAEAIRYALSRWEGLTRFIEDGRIEIDNNAVERSIRPIALNRKNALFAGSDSGAEHWATIASLIETCKLNDVDPLSYLADVLTRIVNGHPNSEIDQLLPWAHRSQDLRAVA